MLRRRFMAAVAAGGLLVALTACGDDDDDDSDSSGATGTTTPATSAPATTEPTTGAPSASEVTVTVKNLAYTPAQLTVPVGSTVTWVFEDDVEHDVVADDGSFKSELLSGGATYKFTFTTAGTFSYLCSVHPFMTGSVTVQ